VRFYFYIRHDRGCHDLIILPLSARRCALFTFMASVAGSLKVAVVPSNLHLLADGSPRLLIALADTAVIGYACPGVV